MANEEEDRIVTALFEGKEDYELAKRLIVLEPRRAVQLLDEMRVTLGLNAVDPAIRCGQAQYAAISFFFPRTTVASYEAKEKKLAEIRRMRAELANAEA